MTTPQMSQTAPEQPSILPADPSSSGAAPVPLPTNSSLPTADPVSLSATELATLRRLGLDGLASPANFTPRYVAAIKRLLGAEEAVGAREQEQGEQGVAGAVNRAEPARGEEVAQRQALRDLEDLGDTVYDYFGPEDLDDTVYDYGLEDLDLEDTVYDFDPEDYDLEDTVNDYGLEDLDLDDY